ncbi:MAG: hypothetical protein CL447_03470 [Acidimicrobiaceae bacterium]|nr:hypothetical protein [Acidimicrobiaceae bacterium]HBU74983.1 hypothetical protein [Acidimicrobiaceae bacterium]|tara:strand:+ start:183 stop:419 length:237 start_codon:yes stop_codon:yes gene_type:complete
MMIITQTQVLSALAIVTSFGIAIVVSAEPTDDAEHVAIPVPPVIDHTTNHQQEHPLRPQVCNEAQLEIGEGSTGLINQ